MGSTSQSTSLHTLITGYSATRELTHSPSDTALIKIFGEMCNSVESTVKDSKPRSDKFRNICRILMRAAYLSPVPEVREMCDRLLKAYRHIFHIRQETSPSRFEGFGFIELPKWENMKSPLGIHTMSHIEWILGSQGRFLELYRRSTELMMNSDGPLPRSWRHFVAMIGAATHKCEYLARQEMNNFLNSGGDPMWLTDRSIIPKKLKCVSDLNAVMAHRPWALDSTHIETTVTAGRWSSGELVHALVILATFQSLSSLVYGAGTRVEDDLLSEEEFSSVSGYSDPLVVTEPVWDELHGLPQCFMVNDGAPNLLQRLLHQQQRGNSASVTAPSVNFTVSGSQRSISSAESGILENPIAAFEGFGSLNEQTGSGSASPVTLAKGTAVPVKATTNTNAPRLREHEKEELSSIMQSHPVWATTVCDAVKIEPSETVEYRDFNPKTDATLHTTSFSWEDHGMMVMARHLADLTDCINEENMHAIEFTTNTIGGSEIESTNTVREAIVKYVQRMYGIFHDDYRYDRLNRILPVIHKAYLKKLACFPERLTRVDYMRMRRFEGFTPKDLIHYAHLVSQTRRIVSLTWAMKAVMRYQAGGSSSANSV
jgi:sestrin